jgi:hypothetical protein
MTMFRFQPAVSLDGPDQSEENPLGVRGLEWLVGDNLRPAGPAVSNG